MTRGATTAEKLRGTKVWVPTQGHLQPGQRPGWGWVQEGFRSPSLWGFRGYTSRKFLKTQMLNPAFLWLLHSLVTILAVKFLAFWKLRPKSLGDQYIVGLSLKVRGTSPYGCCAYEHDELLVTTCNLIKGRMAGKPTRGRRRLQMLEDLYENNSYEVLKRTAEDRSEWRVLQQTTEEQEEVAPIIVSSYFVWFNL